MWYCYAHYNDKRSINSTKLVLCNTRYYFWECLNNNRKMDVAVAKYSSYDELCCVYYCIYYRCPNFVMRMRYCILYIQYCICTGIVTEPEDGSLLNVQHTAHNTLCNCKL